MLPDVVSLVQGDLTDAASLGAALPDVRTVVHTAAMPAPAQATDLLFERVGAGRTEALARAARHSGVHTFVHLGSADVYGDGVTATPHRESAWLHGPACVIMQPTYIADSLRAVQLAVSRNELRYEVISVGGARAREFREFVALVAKRVGVALLQLSAPRWTRPLAAVCERAWSVVGEPRQGLSRLARKFVNTSVNIEKARRLLGFEPVPLERGLDETAAEPLGTGNLTR